MSNQKKSVKKTETKTETKSLPGLLEEAQDLGLNSDQVLSLVTDLKALEKFIQDEKARISELPLIDEVIQKSSLGKAKLNVMGEILAHDWQKYSSAKTGWLKSFVQAAQSQQWIEFVQGQKRLADVEKFVAWYEKNY